MAVYIHTFTQGQGEREESVTECEIRHSTTYQPTYQVWNWTACAHTHTVPCLLSDDMETHAYNIQLCWEL